MQKIFSSNLIRIGFFSMLLITTVFLTIFNCSVVKAENIIEPNSECVSCTYVGSVVKCDDPACPNDGNYAVYHCYDYCNDYYWVDESYFLGCVTLPICN